ncbi:hypothetical protein FACS189440_06360 [Bacteroidia bacterium]|nr:hypothetical protein FACS189440_06360 [Bacteroidia bacterium]
MPYLIVSILYSFIKKTIIIMKHHLFFLVLSFYLSTVLVSAQEEETTSYLFSDYMPGYVMLKENNAKIAARLNYDLVDERMLFQDEDLSVTELSASEVIVVVIDGRYFYPAEKNAFNELISLADNNEFYIRWKVRIISDGKMTGYGSYSPTASVGSVGMINSGSGGVRQLRKDELFKGIREQDYFLKNGKKLVKFNSAKTLGKLFKNHEEEIENFAQTNQTDFSKPEDVKAILEYAFSLPKK